MKQTTREKIVQAAIVVLATNPVASLDEIAASAGVGRATLFRHFESRAELIKQLILEAAQKMSAGTTPIFESDLPALEKFQRLVSVLIPMGSSLQFSVYAPLLQGDPTVLQDYKEYLTRLGKLCIELKTEAVIAQEIPDAWLVAALDKLIFAAWESIQNGNIAANDAPELVLRVFLKGIGCTH